MDLITPVIIKKLDYYLGKRIKVHQKFLDKKSLSYIY